MSVRIRGSYDDALYKSTYTFLYFICTCCIQTYSVPHFANDFDFICVVASWDNAHHGFYFYIYCVYSV